MQIIVHQQMNIIPGIVILLFLTYASSVLDKSSYINKIYLNSLLLNLMLIFINIMFNILDNFKAVPEVFSYIMACLMFIFYPFLSYLYLNFVCAYFSNPIKLKRKANNTFLGLILFNAVIMIIILLIGMYKNNHEINFYIFPYITSIIFIIYSIFIILAKKKLLIKFEYIYIITISLINALFVLIQLFNGTKYIWYSSTFALVLMFIVIQQRELYRDTLTGAKNRLILKKLLDDMVKRPGKKFSAVMIDLDYFKNINDSYGHSEGDIALKTFAKILQKVYSDCGIVVRMGGDEFLILIYETREVNELISRMGKLVDRYNNNGLKPYRIKYSCAYGTYDSSKISIDQFMHEIDMKMYQSKNEKKSKMLSIENI